MVKLRGNQAENLAGAASAETKAEAAAYIADLTADLVRIARAHRLDVLGYLLDMARLEANTIAGKREPGDVPLN